MKYSVKFYVGNSAKEDMTFSASAVCADEVMLKCYCLMRRFEYESLWYFMRKIAVFLETATIGSKFKISNIEVECK